MLRLMIIDDEPRARRGLKRLIDQCNEVEVVGEAGMVADARSMIDQLRPDAIFLDIELKDGHGFDLIDNMQDPPAVVFVTAHSNYAPKAFDVSAVDYLLKPVTKERLFRSLERLRRIKESIINNIGDNNRLFLKIPKRSLSVLERDIVLLLAEGDFTRIFTKDGQDYFVCRLLGSFERELTNPSFIRISRSIILNSEQVESVVTSDGKTLVSFKGRLAPIEVGRIPARRLLKQLAQ